MFKVTNRNGSVFGNEPYICEFVCDTTSDVPTLPTSISEGTGGKTKYDNQLCSSGSIATVIDNGSNPKKYILDNRNTWCPYSVSEGSSISITVDSSLSDSSKNPVENKVVTAAIGSKADKTDIPTKMSQLENDSGYLTEHQDLSDYALKSLYGDTTINVGRLADSTVGDHSTAEGYGTTASGYASHAEGSNCSLSNTALSDRTVTISDVDYTISGSTAYGTNSHAEGTQSFAYKYSSHAEGYNTTASGLYSHAEGYHTTASSSASHAEGYVTTASGLYSHAEGVNTTASGTASHAEGSNYSSTGDAMSDRTVKISSTTYTITGPYAYGINSHAEGTQSFAYGYASHTEGHKTTASGLYSHAEGDGTSATRPCSHAEGSYTTASGDDSHAEGIYTIATNEASHAGGHYNANMTTGGYWFNTTGTAFVIGNGTDKTALSNAFSVQYDGIVKAKSTITASTTADYAEFFEWIDGNPDNDDRIGYFVTLDGDKIRIATNEDDYILGIVSGEPFVLGNGDCDTWNGMFLRDEFRRTIYEPAPKMVEILDRDGNPTGEFEEVEGEFEGTRPKLNPEYDHTQPYISRFDRKEWAPVGMLGVLAVRHDGTAQVNGYVTVNADGIATACDKNAENSYRVIKSNSDTVVEIIFR